MARVILEHLSKRYGDFVALNDLSMEIRDKEFFILLGPSGCGKSTLLRLIAGLEKPSEGRIIIGDKLVNDLLPWQRGVAMAFESPSFGLMPNMTAYDSMAFGLRFSKPGADPNRPHSAAELEGPPASPAAAQGEIRKRVERVASRLGIGGYLGRKQDELSAGHRQTVALGRAVTRQPQVFLLDDPLSQADSSLRASSRMELRRIHSELQTTIVYVTHDQLEAMSLGSRIAVLNKGVLQQVSTPQALYERPANTFVATFIGSPPMNLFRFELGTDGTRFNLRTAGGGANPEIDLAVPDYVGQRLSDHIGRSLLIGVRPEQMHDAALLPADSAATARISADVELTEYTGQEVYYHLVAAGQRFVARLDGRTAAHIGQRISIAFDPADIHAFDLQSERNLL